MRQFLDYNIHDILKFQIIRNGKFGFRDLLNLRFSCFETGQVDKPDIVLNIGRFTPSNENCYLVDYKYYIKDDYFYCHESEGKARWEVEITGLEQGDTVINLHVSTRRQIQPVDLLRILLFLPQSFLLRIIEHKLGVKGYFLTHSAAISKDNQAYLLSGRAGGFKTSLCMDFVRRAGFTCLGDDRVILYRDRVLSFPMNYAMFEFMTQRLPDETHFGILKQVQFVVEQFRGKHKKREENGGKSAKLNAMFLIAKSSGLHTSKKVSFEPLPQPSLEQVVNNLLLSARLEDFSGMGMPSFGISSAPFLRYMLAYSFVFPGSPVATLEEKLAESLRSSLKNIPIYRVEIPSDYSPDTFDQIHQFIARNC